MIRFGRQATLVHVSACGHTPPRASLSWPLGYRDTVGLMFFGFQKWNVLCSTYHIDPLSTYSGSLVNSVFCRLISHAREVWTTWRLLVRRAFPGKICYALETCERKHIYLEI